MPQPPALAPLDEIQARLDRLIAGSPADSTEATWIEVRRASATDSHSRRSQPAGGAPGGGRARAAGGTGSGGGGGDDVLAAGERTLLLRVRQSGRTGLHRTGAGEPSEIENALRDALAQARLAEPTPAEPLPGPGGGQGQGAAQGGGEPAARADAAARGPDDEALYDPEIAQLLPARARELLDSRAERGERLRLSWLTGHVAVANSAGLRRAVRVTAITLTASCGQGPGAGRATGSARRLQLLGAATLLDRARRRHAAAGAVVESLPPGMPVAGAAGPGAAAAPQATWLAAAFEVADVQAPGFAAHAESLAVVLAAAPPPGAAAPLPEASGGPLLVLSEQATAALLDLLNRHALAAAAYRDPHSWSHGRLGQVLFSPCLQLRDDATDPLTLAFPFDLSGWSKRPVDLIAGGALVSPAIDPALGRDLNRSPTPHALAPDESIATNLLLFPAAGTGLGEDDLLRQAEGGLWISALTDLHCFDPRHLRFRATARGVHRIQAGALAAPLPDLRWEDHLPAVLRRISALGNQPVAIAVQDPLFGATAAPLAALHPTQPLYGLT